MPHFGPSVARAACRSAGTEPLGSCRLDRLGRRQRQVEVLVDEQAPDVLERIAADELFDVDAAIAEVAAVFVGLGDLRLERDDAFEAGAEVAGRLIGRERYTRCIERRWPTDVYPGRRRDGAPRHPHSRRRHRPELTEATRRVLEATGVAFDWDVRQAGVDVMEEAGTPLPEETLASVKANKVALKGPITTPIGTGFRSVNVALRHELGLYACLRPCKTYRGVRSRYDNVDLVIVRENTEDLYAGIEYEAGHARGRARDRRAQQLQAKQIAARLRHFREADQPRRLGADHPLRVRVRARSTAASASRA